MNLNKEGGGGSIILCLLRGLLKINELISLKFSSNAEKKN